ncbi:myosin heavy-chain kinase [Nitzschia inconspicua]|uniref:Myosin heavy-chain kinase n=1 Tax=Nitzschia inconspicua TaxID=303405 RepID=A0A9K3M6W9_9STRA|nr:myosin heavy-chain kinase [Nitzschia inconspicua]
MKDIHDATSASFSTANALPQRPVARLSGHDGPVQDVCWHGSSKTTKYCLTAGHDRSVRLWNPFRVDPDYIEKTKQNMTKKRPIPQAQHSAHQDLPRLLEIQKYTSGLAYEVNAIAVAGSSSSDRPDLLLAASNKTMHVMDIVTAKSLRKLDGHHSGRINSVAAYQQEVYLSASFDTTVALWDGRALNNRRPIQILSDAKDSITDVLVTVDEALDDSYMNSCAYIRTASVDGCIRTYDLRKGILQSDSVGSSITTISLSKDRQCLVVSCLDGCIRLLDINSGELMNTYQGDHVAGNYGLQVDILADDATIVSGSEDGSVVLYDLVSAASKILPGETRRPTCAIAAHPTQPATLLTASYDNRTVVWSHEEDTRWQEQLSIE